MSFLYVPGSFANTIAHPKTVITPTPAESASFPVSRIGDGRLDRVFRFGSSSATYTINVFGDRNTNGGLETWSGGVPLGWTKKIVAGNPVIQEETTIIHGGASSAEYIGDSGDDEAELYQDFDAFAGELLRLDVWLRGNGTFPARVSVLDMTTGKALTNTNTWSTVSQDVTSGSSTSFVQTSLSFNVESYAASGIWNHTLRFRLRAIGSGTCYWDDCFIFAPQRFFAILGHNLTKGWVAEILDNAGPTLIETMTIRNRAFFHRLASVSNRRAHNIRFTAPDFWAGVAPSDFPIPRIGEVVMGNALTLGKGPTVHSDLDRSESWPRIDIRGPFGHLGSVKTKTDPHIAPFTIAFRGQRTDLDEALEVLWQATQGGSEPLVFVPDDGPIGGGDVFMGRIMDRFTAARVDHPDVWEYGVEFEHLPYASVMNTV